MERSFFSTFSRRVEPLFAFILGVATRRGEIPPISVGVLVSGGVDSMVLLTLLARFLRASPYTGGWLLSALHFNHHLRPEALADAGFVEGYCRANDIPCQVFDLQGLDSGGNIQGRARAERLGILINHRGIDFFFAGHHFDDNLENFFIKIIKNKQIFRSPLMAPRTRIGDKWLLRPLLGFGKREIREWGRENGVPYHEDSSNDTDRYLRNRVRRGVIAPLAELMSREGGGTGASLKSRFSPLFKRWWGERYEPSKRKPGVTPWGRFIGGVVGFEPITRSVSVRGPKPIEAIHFLFRAAGVGIRPRGEFHRRLEAGIQRGQFRCSLGEAGFLEIFKGRAYIRELESKNKTFVPCLQGDFDFDSPRSLGLFTFLAIRATLPIKDLLSHTPAVALHFFSLAHPPRDLKWFARGEIPPSLGVTRNLGRRKRFQDHGVPPHLRAEFPAWTLGEVALGIGPFLLRGRLDKSCPFDPDRHWLLIISLAADHSLTHRNPT